MCMGMEGVVLYIIMPPLPTTFDDAINASIASIQRRQNDLREFQIPRLRGCSESLAVQQQYAAELREDLETITHLVEVNIHDFLLLVIT
jgi:protein transport protein SEC20